MLQYKNPNAEDYKGLKQHELNEVVWDGSSCFKEFDSFEVKL